MPIKRVWTPQVKKEEEEEEDERLRLIEKRAGQGCPPVGPLTPTTDPSLYGATATAP